MADKAAAALDEAGGAFKEVGANLKTLDVRILAVAVAFGIIFFLAFLCVDVGLSVWVLAMYMHASLESRYQPTYLTHHKQTKTINSYYCCCVRRWRRRRRLRLELERERARWV